MPQPSLDDLLAQSLVVAQLGRVARLLDGKRWSELGTVFRDDVEFDYGDGKGTQHGLPHLRDTFSRHLDRCGPTQHLLGSIVVEVIGESAVSRTYVQARHAGTGGLASEVFDTSGEYVDTWGRAQDTWLVVRREVRWSVLAGNPAVLDL